MPELFSYELELNPARRGPSAFAVEGNLRKDLEARIRATDAPDYETGEARPRTFGLILERSSRGSVKPPALVVDPPFSSEEGHPVVDPRDGVTKPQFFVMRRASSRTEDAFEVRRSARTGKDYGVVAALISRFSLFSNTSKMSCPSWSLPAGHSSVGGSCPTAAQYHLRPSTRNGVLRLLEASQAALWNRPLPAEATMEENRKGEERLKSNVICDFCVAGDTLLLVRNGGLLPLSDVVRRVEQGEAVEVNDRGRWVKVTRSWRKGTRSVVRITTTCGLELVCTPDHKIMTTDGWVEAGELVPHDHLVLSLGSGHPEDAFPARCPIPPVETTPAEDARGARLPDFPGEWSREVGWVLGYLVGNGSVTSGTPYPEVRLVDGGEDHETLSQLAQLISRWCGSDVAARLVDVPGFLPQSRAAWRRGCLTRFLADSLGLDKGVDPVDRRIPSSLWRAPWAGVAGFLSGLFTTDGSVVDVPQSHGAVALILASVSRGLLQDVQKLLAAAGIRATICAYTTSNAQRLADGHRALFKLEIKAKDSVARFRDLVGLASPRLQSKLAAADLEYRKPWSTRRWAAVASIAACDPVDVYDIEVDHPDHAFGAAGLCVSNCYAGKGNYGNLSTQLAQSLRFEWLKDILSEGGPEGAAELLAQAIRHQQAWIARTAKRREALNPRFFRIHDSGDFHNYDALETWIRVARLLPDVHFWAPTRMHHFPNFLEAAADAPENLSIRPSVLLVGDVPPDLRDYPGFAGGTTVAESQDLGALSQELDALIWDCPVYMRKGRDKTCRASTNPQGKPHCRVCWGVLPKANGLHKSEKFKQAFVNYHPH